MNEKAIVFGRSKTIVGIVADPARDVPTVPTGVVILNAGVLHRVGPNRIHVRLARELAARGFPSIRFDFSGIGDSAAQEIRGAFVDAAVDEARHAMDALGAARSIEDFLIIGICSGADLGLAVARADPRVRGAALVDCFNLPTRWIMLQHSKRHLLSPRSWVRFLTGKSLLWKALRSGAADAEQVNAVSIIPTYDDFVEGLRSLTERGSRLLLLFTGKSPAYTRYANRLRRVIDAWPRSAELVRAEYLEHTDHTFTIIENQERFVRLVADWAAGEKRS